MPRFQGIPVDAQQSTKPRFAGIPVDDNDASNQLPTQVVHAPARLPGVLGDVNDFGNDLGDATAHHLLNIPVGLAQTGAHWLQGMVDMGAPSQDASGNRPGIGGKLADYVDTKVGALDQSIQNREANYQRDVPTNTASLLGAVTGEALPFALSAPARGLSMAGEVAGNLVSRFGPLASKAVSGATQGAILGSAQPVTEAGDYGLNKAKQTAIGAAFGGAIPVASRAASEVGNVVRPIFSPKSVAGQNLARLIGSDPQTLAKLDAGNITGVPGVQPTSAQVAPSPSAVLAEKALGNTGYKEQLMQRQNENNQARLDVLRGIAGDESQMQAAHDARAAATDPYIKQHLQPNTPAIRWTNAGKSLDDLLSKPMNQGADLRALQDAKKVVQQVKNGSLQEDDALQSMKDLEESVSSKKVRDAFANAFSAIDQNMVDPTPILRAAALTRNTGLGARLAVSDALDKIMASINQSKNIRGLVPADVLDSIRENINDFLVSPTGKQASAQEKLGVAPIRDTLVKTLGQHAPGYSDYLAAYAKHSEPINTMRAAQAILEPVDSRLSNSAGAAPLSLGDINQGLSKIDKGRYGVSADARQKLDALKADLKQQGISGSAKFPGSDTAYNAQAQGSLASALLGPNFGGPTGKARLSAAALGGLIGEHFGGPGSAAAGAGIGAFINKAADVVNKRIMDQYAKGLMNPQEAATLIKAYLNGNQTKASKLLSQYPQWNLLISAGNQGAKSLQKANP